jgi:hypothetical protein
VDRGSESRPDPCNSEPKPREEIEREASTKREALATILDAGAVPLKTSRPPATAG